jgi:hypothetical protein
MAQFVAEPAGFQGQDLDANERQTLPVHSELPRRAGREIDDPAVDKRAAVVDLRLDGAAIREVDDPRDGVGRRRR